MHQSTFVALSVALLCASWVLPADARIFGKSKRDEQQALTLPDDELEPCLCGVFMSGQLNRTARARGRRAGAGAPRGQPVLEYETEEACVPCGSQGYKMCVNRCLDVIVKHLPKAGPLVCSALDRDCRRERAHLYIRNCDAKWISTNFSAGKEFCCKDGEPVKCTDL